MVWIGLAAALTRITGGTNPFSRLRTTESAQVSAFRALPAIQAERRIGEVSPKQVVGPRIRWWVMDLVKSLQEGQRLDSFTPEDEAPLRRAML